MAQRTRDRFGHIPLSLHPRCRGCQARGSRALQDPRELSLVRHSRTRGRVTVSCSVRLIRNRKSSCPVMLVPTLSTCVYQAPCSGRGTCYLFGSVTM